MSFASFAVRVPVEDLDGAKFSKLCRDAKLLGKRFGAIDVDIVFAKVKVGNPWPDMTHGCQPGLDASFVNFFLHSCPPVLHVWYVMYGNIVCHVWQYCMSCMATLYFMYGNLVCHVWQCCMPCMAILYVMYGITRLSKVNPHCVSCCASGQGST